MENELKETEKGIANLIKVIEKGVISDAVTSRLEKLEKDKANLKEAMEAEKLKYALAEDENSIKKYFDMYAKADFDDEDTRNKILDYFIDKIYVYNDRLVITWWYCDDRTTIELDTLTEITELQDKTAAAFGNEKLHIFRGVIFGYGAIIMVSGVSLVAGGADRNNARRISVARQRQSDGKGSGMTSLICSKCQTDDQWFSLPGCDFV